MMSDLRPGDKLLVAGKPDTYFEVLDSRVHAGTINVFDAQKRESRYVDEATIRAGISNGSLVLRRKGMPAVSVCAQYDNPALRARVRFLYEILRRIAAIKAKQHISFDAAIPFAREAYLEEHADDPLKSAFPSRATLFRAHKKQSSGLPVLNGDKNKGNKMNRYSSELCEFVDEAIQNFYLVTESRWTARDLTDYINREARSRGLHVAKHTISRKFVTSRIYGLTADAEYDRMDPLMRVAGKSFAKSRIRAPFPFARIEQDAVHLPFVVTTPHGIARNVYLVAAVDVCTGYPVGWHLVIGAPREMDSLSCLAMYLTPAKASRFKELGLTNAINIYGTPSVLVFDNGPETKGDRIFRLKELEVDVMHCKAKAAQGKPFIERLNRALKEALQRQQGCTRFEGQDGVRDPVALGDKLMTFDELEKWIVRWFYESWVHTELERLRWDELLVDSVKGKTPFERLKYMTEEMGHPITMPPSRQQWMMALYEHRERKLSAKTGITLEHGFRYKGEAMTYLLEKYGDHAPLHVYYNPDDFRQAYVFEDDSLPLVTLTHEHVRPDTPAWTFAEAKARFDAGMTDWTVPSEKMNFLRDLDDAVTRSSNAGKSKSRSKREENKETVRRAKVHAASERAIERPLSSDAPFGPAPSTNTSLSAEDPQLTVVSYDEAPSMTIVNRKTGEKLL
ncbi:transposase family protein [uncultured Herbaspirillum sp.]|uniref:integrase catalytic domain-containing protein n=1 Tax=uncultured Herbaspirillum sp. TaxID=160236 RepID=UPI00258661A3|nr:transposase family protein [uncultured Herbaspirillum sp.]